MKLFPNFGLPTAAQWDNILTAMMFSFSAGFLAVLTAQGGIKIGLGWEGFLSLIGGAMVSGFNGALYTLYVILFKKAE